MILIFSESNDISTRDIKERLRDMSQDVLEISMGTPDMCFEYIGNDKIIFRDKKSEQIYDLLEASACWWRRTGLTKQTLLPNYPSKIDAEDGNLDFLIQGDRNILNYEFSSLKEYINNIILLLSDKNRN